MLLNVSWSVVAWVRAWTSGLLCCRSDDVELSTILPRHLRDPVLLFTPPPSLHVYSRHFFLLRVLA